MPQSSEKLQKKFMIDGSDGIGEAEDIIINAGGRVEQGFITLPLECNDDIFDAAQFLIEEWDYDVKPR